MLRYVKAIANIIYKGICCQQWLAVFFVDVLPMQTEKYWNCFGILLLMYLTPEFRRLGYSKNKLYKTLDYWSRDMLNFNFSEKGLELVCPKHFVYGFSRKMLLMLYSINWPSFIVRLPLLLEILDNMCIRIVFC